MWKSILLKRKSSTNLLDKNSNGRRSGSLKPQLLLRTRPNLEEIHANELPSKEFSAQTKSGKLYAGVLRRSDLKIINIWPRRSPTSTSETQTNMSSSSTSTQTLNLDESLSERLKLRKKSPLKSQEIVRGNVILTNEIQNERQNIENMKVKDMVNSLEAQMNSISLSSKIHKNSTDSPTKQKRLQTGARNLDYPDEKLRIVTEKLIKELERVQEQSKKFGKNMSNSVGAHSKTLVTSKQLDSAVNQCNYVEDPQVECLMKSNHNISEYQSLYKEPDLVDTKVCGSNMCGNESYNGSNEFDWLEMIRRVTFDKTLTLQQRDEKLDRIAEVLIERRNGLSGGI